MTPPVRIETLCYQITQHCNLACSHCRSGSSPTTVVHSATDQFIQFATKAIHTFGLRHVSISGGEPSIDNRLQDVVRNLISLGLHVTVTTNGIASERVQSLALQGRATHLRIRVSIDGPKNVHDEIRGPGTFAKALRTMRRVRDCMGWVGMNTVAMPRLLPFACELANIAIAGGACEWALITPVPQGAALGRPWHSETLVPAAWALRDALSLAGFCNRILVWDFISTPDTSLLVEANGDIVLSGVGANNRQLTTLSDPDFNTIAHAVNNALRLATRTHFTWKQWR